MNNVSDKVTAKFNSKNTWITLWTLALAGILIALHALSLIKPKTCIVMCVLALAFSVAGTLVGLCATRTKLEIQEKLVFCKTLFGKSIYIPVDMVTGVKTTLFRTVCIYAPSCKIRCSFVINAEEFAEVIKEKIQNR